MIKKAGLTAVLISVIGLGTGSSPVSSQVSSVEFPLSNWLGFGHDAAADDAYFKQQEIGFEDLVQECMQADGFEYWPVTSVEVGEDQEVTAAAMWDLLQSHPNTAYRGSFTKVERKVYDLALAGVPNANSPRALIGGCLGIADKRVPSIYTAYNALRHQYVDLQLAISTDQRVLDAEVRWSQCMEALGFVYPTIEDMHASIGVAVQQGLSTQQVDEVTAVYERALEASPDCLYAARYQPSWDATQVDHEQVFVNRHREILDMLGVES
jgi:hypothetical protein